MPGVFCAHHEALRSEARRRRRRRAVPRSVASRMIAEVKFVDGGGTELLVSPRASNCARARIQGVEARHIRAALRDRVGIVLRPVVQKIISGHHSPARSRRPAGKRLCHPAGSGCKPRWRTCRSRYWARECISEDWSRARTMRFCGITALGKTHWAELAQPGEVIGLARVDPVAELLRELAGEIRAAHGGGDRVSI